MYINWANDLQNSKDHKGAFEKITLAFHQSPGNKELEDTYINFGNLYALYEITSGRVENGMRLFEDLYTSYPEHPTLKDKYISAARFYGLELVKTAKPKEVVNFMDSLLAKFPDNQAVKSNYAQTILFSISASGLHQENPEEAKNILLKAYNADPTNNFVLRAVAAIYHSLAMDEVRKNNFDAAKMFILDGLKYVPSDRMLEEDLDLIKDRQKRP